MSKAKTLLGTKRYKVQDFTELSDVMDRTLGGISQRRELFAYRGQCDAAWELEASFDRLSLPPSDRVALYGDMLQRLLRVARRRKVLPPSLEGDDPGGLDRDPFRLNLEAFAQHYGLPTRLLDWSERSSVAAFFAFEGCIGSEIRYGVRPRYCAVYALDKMQVHRLFSQTGLEMFDGAEMNDRLSAQSGCFTRLSSTHPSIEQHLHDYYRLRIRKGQFRKEDVETVVHKFVIGTAKVEQAMVEMEDQTITHSSLFPDADGACREALISAAVQWSGQHPRR